MARDLVPPGYAGLNLAHYRTLLPLYNAEQNTFRPWVAFRPDSPDGLEQLRTMDLYDLRQTAVDAGKRMAGWDSPRGRVSEEFTATLGEALDEFVPADANWTVLRWQGHRHDLPQATPVTFGDLEYGQQEMGLTEVLSGILELGMPEFIWCSTGSFAWGAPLYPDFGVMTMAAGHYIRHFAPRNFESFYLRPDAVLPDNLGD